MKKLTSFVLAMAMAAVCAAPAMAADNQITQSTSGSCDTAVTFTIDPAYQVTIPAKVTLNKTEGETITYESDLTLKASNVRLNQGKKLQVSIPAGSTFTLTSEENAKLDYTIDGKTPSTTDVVATFETKATDQTETLHIKAADPEFAGVYTGTLTFVIAVANTTT